MAERIDIDKPRWDQTTFLGRFKYYAWITDPRTVLASKQSLEDARDLLQKYRYAIPNLVINHLYIYK